MKKVDDFSMKDNGCEEEVGAGSRRQMDDSANIHGKLGFYWENLKLSFCGYGELNSQLLIKCINCHHEGISQFLRSGRGSVKNF